MLEAKTIYDSVYEIYRTLYEPLREAVRDDYSARKHGSQAYYGSP
jgi:hypothetical protein